ncbi:MAG: hypothetical protein LBK99_16770, partial [Opitutaceae bacterium]|nr:hypothetical protein [Opitutaceae bacterium]
ISPSPSPPKKKAIAICGLDKAVPSDATRLQALHNLNLARQRWQDEINVPVVFWIPSWLATLMAWHAPDFFAWQRAIITFADDAPLAALAPLFNPARMANTGGINPLTTGQHRQRLEELEHRLNWSTASTDPATLDTRARWRLEIAEHHYWLGQPDKAPPPLAAALSHWEHANKPREKALALIKIAEVQARTGHTELARNNAGSALQLFRECAANHPDDEDIIQKNLAATLQRLGDICQRNDNNPTAARKIFEEYHDLCRKHVEAAPGNPAWLRSLAISLERLGSIAAQQDQRDIARKYFDESLLHYRRLAGKQPASDAMQRGPLSLLGQLADLAIEANDTDAALSLLTGYENILQRLLDADPQHPDYLTNKASLLDRHAHIAFQKGDTARSLELQQKSLALRRHLSDTFPQETNGKANLVRTLNRIAQLHAIRGEQGQAQTSINESLSVVDALHQRDPASTEARALSTVTHNLAASIANPPPASHRSP